MKMISASSDSMPTGWLNGPLLGFDTETNGIDVRKTRIVSAAFVHSAGYQAEPKVKEFLFKCPDPIPLECTAIHGISDAYSQEHGTDHEAGIREILSIFEKTKCPVVGTNITFDLSILVYEAERYGIDARTILGELLIFDTLVMDRHLDPYRRGRRTLTSAAASYGIAIQGAHTASGDVICGLKLARAMGSKYLDLGNRDLRELMEIQRTAYREQMNGLEKFRRIENPEFCVESIEWPYPA